MKNRRIRGAVLAICLMAVTAAVHAQSSEVYTFTIQRPFTAGKQTLPAGRYEVKADGAGGFLLQGNAKPVRVVVVTRLAKMQPETAPARFVFDALETGEQILSEIWLPGQDGYLVCTLEKAHHHVLLESKK